MVTAVDGKGIAAQAQELEKKSAQDVLRWALEKYHPDISLACSLGAEDVVLVDMLMKIRKDARIFLLDTGRLNPETYDVMQALEEKYGLHLEVYFPDAPAVETMVRTNGINLFYESIENRKRCCGIRKVEPLNRALSGLSAWITGLRRDQNVTRTDIPKIEADGAHNGMIKVNPIVDWTWENVWEYIKENKVPYNKLHDQSYPSIGCAPCTRAVKPGEDLRAGRWWWESPDQKECGLHVKKQA